MVEVVDRAAEEFYAARFGSTACVGVTPMLSMFKALAHRGVDVPVCFVHGTRNSRTHALDGEVGAAAARLPKARVHVRYNEPLPGDVDGRRCDAVGRIDVPLLRSLLPGVENADFYICGPKPFMACLYRELQEEGVPESRVHFEFFGPKQDLATAASEPAAANGVPALA